MSPLVALAATLGFVHTLVGVDHTVPFVALGRAQGWSLARTLLVTLLCGVAHVASSVIIGLAGLALGFAVGELSWVEAFRGQVAAWVLVAFGIGYALWGLRRARRGVLESAGHEHPRTATVMGLFVAFVLGPCEVLIPLLIVPALERDLGLTLAVIGVFGAATLATMLGVVALGHAGARLVRVETLERHLHVIAGLAVALSGVGILVGL